MANTKLRGALRYAKTGLGGVEAQARLDESVGNKPGLVARAERAYMNKSSLGVPRPDRVKGK